MLIDVSLPVAGEAASFGHMLDAPSAGTETRSARGILYGVMGGSLLWLVLILALWLHA